MNFSETESRAAHLASRYTKARPPERENLRPEIERIIRTLRTHHQPMPRALYRVEAQLDQDAFDDMFDNMPI